MVARIVLVKDSSNTHPNAWDIDKHKESKGLGVSLRLNRTPNQTLHPAPTLALSVIFFITLLEKC